MIMIFIQKSLTRMKNILSWDCYFLVCLDKQGHTHDHHALKNNNNEPFPQSQLLVGVTYNFVVEQ
jgi:hypothetical protein